MAKTFSEWMDKVNKSVVKRTGKSALEIAPRYTFQDDFNDERTVSEMVALLVDVHRAKLESHHAGWLPGHVGK